MKSLILMVGLFVLVGCVQAPTRTTQTVDDRPGITFDIQGSEAKDYELYVDDVSYGMVGDYLEGENLLRLVDGTHFIELHSGEDVVFREKVYLGAGVDQVIKVGEHE